MPKPLVLFPDPMLVATRILRARLVAPLYTGPPVTVGTKVPTSSSTDTPSTPYVLVRADASQVDYPVSSVATVRVAVWADQEVDGLALATLCQGVLLAYPGDADVRVFASLTGPVPTSDPETGNPLSSFTVAARLRPASTLS